MVSMHELRNTFCNTTLVSKPNCLQTHLTKPHLQGGQFDAGDPLHGQHSPGGQVQQRLRDHHLGRPKLAAGQRRGDPSGQAGWLRTPRRQGPQEALPSATAPQRARQPVPSQEHSSQGHAVYTLCTALSIYSFCPLPPGSPLGQQLRHALRVERLVPEVLRAEKGRGHGCYRPGNYVQHQWAMRGATCTQSMAAGGRRMQQQVQPS